MSHKLLFMYRGYKVQFSKNALKLKKSCQKKFLKIFQNQDQENVCSSIKDVILYKNNTDESPSSKLYKKLRRGSHATSTFT